jgi:hypothetical protein
MDCDGIYRIDDVAKQSAWGKDRAKVLEFLQRA